MYLTQKAIAQIIAAIVFVLIYVGIASMFDGLEGQPITNSGDTAVSVEAFSTYNKLADIDQAKADAFLKREIIKNLRK